MAKNSKKKHQNALNQLVFIAFVRHFLAALFF